jgi:hypothetical protein
MTKTTIQSVINGKAYEFACIIVLQKLIESVRPIEIIKNNSLDIAKERYNEISEMDRFDMLKSATAGMKVIIDMEPKIMEDKNDKLTISLQPDNIAKSGDIRDVLIICCSTNWEIGISVKHNHVALKHSRLSAILDFGKMWFNKPCSKNYFDEIAPIFTQLKVLKNDNKLWSAIPNKDKTIYLPILRAFMKEFNALYETCGKIIVIDLVKYLLGSSGKDYYKMIHYNNNITRIQPFNLLGTLNTVSSKIKPKINFGKMLLPIKILDISFKENSTTTLHMTMDNGWAISFRIHNASSKVEPSLKFDIQLLCQPADIFYIDVKW